MLNLFKEKKVKYQGMSTSPGGDREVFDNYMKKKLGNLYLPLK